MLVTNALYTLTNQVVVASGVTVRSYNNGVTDRGGTVVNGNWPNTTNRCFTMNANSTLDGFTVSNGCEKVAGGGILFSAGGTVTNCVIGWCLCTNNSGNILGGGIYFDIYNVSGGLLVDSTVCNNKLRGSANPFGAGIYMFYPMLATHVRHCVIVSNSATTSAGGIQVFSGVGLIVVDSTISYNTGGNGGGISGNGIFSNCFIGWNSGSDFGGGMYLGSGGTLLDCTIASNIANVGGGVSGDYNAGAKLIQNCRISGNSAYDGGGVQLRADGTVRNCLIDRNSATDIGGGIFSGWNGAGPVVVENCTIVSNQAGNITAAGFNVISGVVSEVRNSIIMFNGINVGPDTVGTNNWAAAAGAVFSFTNSCTSSNLNQALPGSGNITNNPRFVNADTANWRLTPHSPCINTGTNQGWMTNSADLDGRTRIRYGAVDMGAYEFLRQGTMFSVR